MFRNSTRGKPTRHRGGAEVSRRRGVCAACRTSVRRAAILAVLATLGCSPATETATPDPASPNATTPDPATGADGALDGSDVRIVLRRGRGELPDAFEVTGLSGDVLRRANELSPQRRPEVFAVYVVSGEKADGGEPADGHPLPAIGGRYEVTGAVFRFLPRYPLEPGLKYRARFRLDDSIGAGRVPKTTEETFSIPPAAAGQRTIVEAVYPSGDRLPENLLRFYIHFSAPMQRGNVYEFIRLLDADGRAIELPFLTLEQELWDPEQRRFTLLFDPGRVKRELKPNKEAGPPLVAGRSYTLEIDGAWRDAAGEPLGEPFRKSFQVVAADRRSPDPGAWDVALPQASTHDPLVVTLREPIDRAQALSWIWLEEDARGTRIDGSAVTEQGETSWRFTPSTPWKPGRYTLAVDPRLEDQAGNSVARPFEVDLTASDPPPASGSVRRPFRIDPIP